MKTVREWSHIQNTSIEVNIWHHRFWKFIEWMTDYPSIWDKIWSFKIRAEKKRQACKILRASHEEREKQTRRAFQAIEENQEP